MSNGTPSTDVYADSQVTYDTPDTGYGASTTGTIYGVYDMSGGAYEYVMGNLNNISGNSPSYNSGFCGTMGPTDGTCREWPNVKYYDLYESNVPYTGYKFGDGTYETFNWYSDKTNFVNSNTPWFYRGGCYDDYASAGVFDNLSISGYSSPLHASRFAIKP